MTWKNSPTDFGLTVLKDADNLTKKITGEVLQKVVVASPVDTGAFRNNWQVGINSVNGATDLNSTDRSGQGSISRGISTIQSNGGLGKVTNISNSLKYAVRLNDGHSLQAPINFVELSLQSVVNKYK